MNNFYSNITRILLSYPQLVELLSVALIYVDTLTN